MSAEIPKLEALDRSVGREAMESGAAPRTAPLTSSAEASKPGSLESPRWEAIPSRTRFGIGSVAIGLGLMAILGYGVAGLLQEMGIDGVRRLWTASPPAVGLSSLPGVTPSTTRPVVPPPLPPSTALAGLPPAIPLRDQPPRTPPQNLPQFTLRDGEQYDFLFSVDEETLKRLGEIQGQLDGIAHLVTGLNQVVQGIARNTGQGQQETGVRQVRLQQELQAARQEIAALHVMVKELEARIKRSLGFSAEFGVPATAASSGSDASMVGWSVKAVSGDRAWLRTPQGGEVTVTAGDRLKGLHLVRAVDAIQGIVVLGDGQVVRQ